VIDESQQTTRVHFEGLTTRVVDAEGKEQKKTANVLGAVIRSTDHNGYYQGFSYDSFGNLVSVVDSQGNTLHSALYNIRGMKKEQTDMDMGRVVYLPRPARRTGPRSSATICSAA
jgi:YD repeat-containing protein